MKYNLLLFVSVLSLQKCVQPAFLNKEEGAECKNEDGKQWTCRILSECPHIGDFKRSRPDICGFRDKIPIICCPPATKEPDINIEIIPAEEEDIGETTISSNQGVINEEDSNEHPSKFSVSSQKCLEYSKKMCLSTKNENPPRFVRSIQSSYIIPVVVGGKVALEEQFPFMAIIGYGEEKDILWDCGGSIVSEKWVLSAAHCSYSNVGKAKWAAFGATKYDKQLLRNIANKIIQIVLHPEYKRPPIYNDIALYEVEFMIGFSPLVKPICLFSMKTYPDMLTAAGWGTTDFGGQKSSDLLYVNISRMHTPVCKRIYQSSKMIPRGIDDDTMICAGNPQKDTCTGDSGGPLFFKPSAVCLGFQVGVVSFGRRCGIYPGVYTKVKAYLPWIESIVWPNDKEMDISEYVTKYLLESTFNRPTPETPLPFVNSKMPILINTKLPTDTTPSRTFFV